ncbi:UNVERIFIED_CONTAM: hypothetical protein Sangu_2904900 [Sesamum angustifolium]|uniref:Uncharacterized protein n=1 Tax=Sesamum angustifolium TaxID=2727405 RepID=A0AAW2IMZ2_9LAMI
MAKTKKNKQLVETTCNSGRPSLPVGQVYQDFRPTNCSINFRQSDSGGRTTCTDSRPAVIALIFVKEAAKLADITKVGLLDFHGFISDLEVSPFAAKNNASILLTSNISDPRSIEALSGKASKIEVVGAAKTSFQ